MEERNEEVLKLPKNIRQIGDIDDMAKIYIEDYVSTYLKKLRPFDGQGLKIGLLLGNSVLYEGIPYIFIEGAMEIEGMNATAGNISFTNEVWNHTYDDMKKYFDGQSIQGWFICGSLDVKLDPLEYWNIHTQYFPGKNQVLYISPTHELDESLYVTSVNGFYKTLGHSVYYERNEPMQDYMILKKETRKPEPEPQDRAIEKFRSVMEEKKEEAEQQKSKTVNMLYTACTFLSLVVCAIGVTLINTHDKMKSMEAALTQLSNGGQAVMVNETPEAAQTKKQTDAGDSKGGVVVSEVPGNVFPTTEAAEETQAPEETTEMSSETESIDETETEVMESTQETSEEETAAAVANQPQTHIVAEGETLYSICLKYYDSINMVEKICDLNGLEDQDKISIGQELQLP